MLVMAPNAGRPAARSRAKTPVFSRNRMARSDRLTVVKISGVIVDVVSARRTSGKAKLRTQIIVTTLAAAINEV